jgi:hypothetical protein
MTDEERGLARVLGRLPEWVKSALRAEVLIAAAIVFGLALFAWYQLASRFVGTH